MVSIFEHLNIIFSSQIKMSLIIPNLGKSLSHISNVNTILGWYLVPFIVIHGYLNNKSNELI